MAAQIADPGMLALVTATDKYADAVKSLEYAERMLREHEQQADHWRKCAGSLRSKERELWLEAKRQRAEVAA